MEIVALIIGLVLLAVLAAWLRASGIKAQIERQSGADATDALETTRRIDDATRLPLDTDDSREWLRDFGGGPSRSDKR